jgi:hypothetical protein
VKKNVLVIPLPIYKLHVVIAWDCTVREAAAHCRKRGCKLVTEEWIREVASFAEGANGLCTNLGTGNTDVLVWLKEGLYRDSKASEYDTLYHELFHAVDKITKTHNLHGEEECRAYIFGWLITEANKFFWGRKRPKSKKPV